MSKQQRDPPALASPELLAKLNAAAEAAGCSLQELADLVFEAGIAPPKGGDGITQVYTLEDLGKRLFGVMQAMPKSKRAEWFAQLVPAQKTSVIVVLRDQGFRTEVIARDLQISPLDVVRTWNAYSSELGSQVVGIRLDTIAGQIQLAAERSQEMAVVERDYKSYWAIERDKVKLLQAIGIVDSAIRRVEVTHKLSDEQKAELDALADLQQKKEKRRIEIAELGTSQENGDALPDDITEDYDEEEDDDG